MVSVVCTVVSNNPLHLEADLIYDVGFNPEPPDCLDDTVMHFVAVEESDEES